MSSPLQQHTWYHDWCRISRGQQYIRIYVQETTNKGNNKNTKLRTILQRESQNL